MLVFLPYCMHSLARSLASLWPIRFVLCSLPQLFIICLFTSLCVNIVFTQLILRPLSSVGFMCPTPCPRMQLFNTRQRHHNGLFYTLVPIYSTHSIVCSFLGCDASVFFFLLIFSSTAVRFGPRNRFVICAYLI